MIAASGPAGDDPAMRQILSTLGSEKNQFVVGFLDSRRRHFGAGSESVLPAGAAANIASTVVRQHDQDVFAILQAFVRDVRQEARAPGSSGAASGPPSHALRTVPRDTSAVARDMTTAGTTTAAGTSEAGTSAGVTITSAAEISDQPGRGGVRRWRACAGAAGGS